MQLIVLVVTRRYVEEETFAHNTVFQHAMERHIPVLPGICLFCRKNHETAGWLTKEKRG